MVFDKNDLCRPTGISSPSKLSSLVNRSRQWESSSLPGWEMLSGIGKERSQKGSNVVEQWPQWVHSRVDLSKPPKVSTILLLSNLRYLFQISTAFWESLKWTTMRFYGKTELPSHAKFKSWALILNNIINHKFEIKNYYLEINYETLFDQQRCRQMTSYNFWWSENQSAWDSWGCKYIYWLGT